MKYVKAAIWPLSAGFGSPGCFNGSSAAGSNGCIAGPDVPFSGCSTGDSGTYCVPGASPGDPWCVSGVTTEDCSYGTTASGFNEFLCHQGTSPGAGQCGTGMSA